VQGCESDCFTTRKAESALEPSNTLQTQKSNPGATSSPRRGVVTAAQDCTLQRSSDTNNEPSPQCSAGIPAINRRCATPLSIVPFEGEHHADATSINLFARVHDDEPFTAGDGNSRWSDGSLVL
jgi:hypothetical protein